MLIVRKKSAAKNSKRRVTSVKSAPNLRRYLILSLLTFGLSGNAKAQDHIGLSSGIEATDFILQADYSDNISRFRWTAGLGLGVRSSFFQGAVNPKIEGGFMYDLLTSERFETGPQIVSTYQVQRVHRQSKQWWNSVGVGLGWRIIYGQNHKVGLQANWRREFSWYSGIENSWDGTINYWNYNALLSYYISL